MKTRTLRLVQMTLLAILGLSLVAGCKSMPRPKLHWPWASKPAAAEPLANQIAWEAVEGATVVEFPQRWARNTLVIDMTGVAASGSTRMRAKASMGWPVRMALRVRPGSVASIEIVADERVVLPVAAGSGPSTDLLLAPSVYSARTAMITLTWAAAP